MREIGRRRLLGVGAGALLAACVGPASAPPPRRPAQIGYLAVGRAGGANMTAFEQGLSDLGWVKDQNYQLHFRAGSGRDEEFPPLVAELVALKVDVILATALSAVRAAMQATTTTPIVMTSIGDPVRNGLVASLSRPGGNVTGVSIVAPELSGKRLELLKEAVPQVTRVAVLYNPSVPDVVLSWDETERAAPPLGIHLVAASVRSVDDIAAAFSNIRSERAEALIVLSEDVVFQNREPILARATAEGLPTMGPQRAYAVAGSLLAYGPDYNELFRRAASHVDRILKGAKPADVPVEQPAKFELVINLQTASALGLAVPRALLLDATEVIQ